MRRLILPLVAVLGLAAAGTGIGLVVANRGEPAEEVVSRPVAIVQTSPTPTPSPTIIEASATPAATPTEAAAKGGQVPVLQIYRNEKYGYSVTLPEGWRVASSFMQAFAQVRSDPRTTRVPEDWVVLTSLSEAEEQQFIDSASGQIGPALSAWFDFSPGASVHIFPTHLTQDGFLADIVQGGVTRENLDAQDVILASGVSAVRVTRREADDSGDFTYDAVYVPFTSGDCAPFGPCNGTVMRIVKTPDYDKDAFEVIFRSFGDE